jgi:hypothetical protein
MQLYALIINGIVVNIGGWDGQAQVAGGTFVPVTQGQTQIGATYSNGTFTPPTNPVAVAPLTVTATQLRLALNADGIRASVEAAIKTLSQNVQDYYNYSATFTENNPAIVAIATATGYSAAQVNALFILAGTFPASS